MVFVKKKIHIVGSENNFLGSSWHMEVEPKQIRARICSAHLLGLVASVFTHAYFVGCSSLSISAE